MSKNVNKKVAWLLHNNQAYRDSDRLLLLAYWQREGFFLTPEQKAAFMNTTAAESITRARRALKAQYPASEAVDNARFDKYLHYKHERPYDEH